MATFPQIDDGMLFMFQLFLLCGRAITDTIHGNGTGIDILKIILKKHYE